MNKQVIFDKGGGLTVSKKIEPWKAGNDNPVNTGQPLHLYLQKNQNLLCPISRLRKKFFRLTSNDFHYSLGI
ncbi:MAG: hypothetical protein AAF546_14900 [Verrucomicrobiota bacterium]